MDKEQSKRIQIIRGLAILAVVGIHSTKPYYEGIWIRAFLNFAVGTFLFLSGYLTKDDIKSPLLFYKKRILRVLIPYTIWSLLYTSVYNSWGSFLKNYLVGNACDIYYFIIVYIQMVLLTPILIYLINSRFWLWGFVPTVIYLMIRTCIVASGSDLPAIINLNFFYSWLAFYYLGLCYARKRIDIKKIPLLLYVVLLLVLMSLQIFEGHLWLGYYGLFPLNYSFAVSQQKITAVLSTIVTDCILVYYIERNGDLFNTDRRKKKTAIFKDIVICRVLEFICNVFAVIGDVSFGIYLTHVMLLIPLSKYVYSHALDAFPLNMFITTFLCGGIIIGVVNLLIMVFGQTNGKRIGRYLGF